MAARKREVATEFDRRPVGIHVMSGGKGPPQAHLIYQVFLTDGTTKYERGRSIRSLPDFDDLNPHGSVAEQERHAKAYRPDLDTVLRMASMLYRDLEDACLRADDAYVVKKAPGNGIRKEKRKK